MDITVTLSDDEATALRTVVPDPKAWAEQTVQGRARSTLDAIVRSEVDYLMRHDEPLPPTRSEILASAVKAGRAIPVADMAKVDFEAIAQASEPEPTAGDPLDPASHAAIEEHA